LADLLGNMRRTHSCGEIGIKDVGKEVVLMGWVQRRRDHGGVIFIDFRDRNGLTQIVFNPEINSTVHDKAHVLRNEYVLGVRGTVQPRPDGMINPNMVTGEIEVIINELKILNAAKTPPFQIEEAIEVSETIRLKYRHIDLRRESLQQNIIARHQATTAIRSYMNENGFLDIETPVLTKSTPEGARDYLVPSRVSSGMFYALPQSPQIFKQLLMMSGFDRYYQIVKCFRDEDLRADRQPEFTQIDIEASFVGEDDIMTMAEGLIEKVFKDVKGIEIKKPFPRMDYQEAVERYGLDKPDLRFDLELVNISDIVKDAGFKVFANVVQKGGVVKGINAKGQATFTRKEIDGFTDYAAIYRAKGLAWVKVKDDGSWQSPIAKFFSDSEKTRIEQALNMEKGDIIFFVADTITVANEALGNLRNHIAKKMGLIDDNVFSFAWITYFPMFELDEETGKYSAMHHPFTSPLEEDYDMLTEDPLKVRSRAYDMVLNGSEIGGGSIRIHDSSIQKQIFGTLGMDQEEYMNKFGFLVEALESGAPPHGGIAFGLDRLMTILCKEKSIRDVIAFPKTQKATCLMTEAPSKAGFNQLEELSIRVAKLEE